MAYTIGGETVTQEQIKVAQNIHALLRKEGFSDEAICAIIGSYWAESGLRPNAIQDDKTSVDPYTITGYHEGKPTYLSGLGYGLMQWDGGRRVNLLNQKGDKWVNVDSQIDFLLSEISGDESRSLTTYGGQWGYKGAYASWDGFKNTTDLDKATGAFFACVERPKDTSSLPLRKEAAKVFYEILKGKKYEYDPSANTSSDSSSSTGETEKRPKLAEDGASETPHIGYFDAGFINFGDNNDITAGMYDELVKITNERRVRPLPYYDNIRYGSRAYIGPYHLQLGDCCFTIPPEFISVSNESTSQTLTTIRQESSQKLKNGYSKRVVSMDIVLHGKSQINGYKVPGPEGWYYVDGVRQLLAQFKCTPFLPITNLTVNIVYGIYTVALQSVVVSTLPGYPNVMTAHLTLQEIDLSPYIECHNMFFKDMIDWDLFRFYYQRQLTESHEYGKLQSIPVDNKDCHLKLSVLNSIIFDSNLNYQSTKKIDEEDGTPISFYDIIFDRAVVKTDKDNKPYIDENPKKKDTNFLTFINSDKDDVHITEFHAGYSNMLTSVQLAELPHPTMQYIGGMDTTFQVVIETGNEDIVSQIQSMLDANNTLIRNNRDFNGVGFIKVESELFSLFGTSYVYVDSIISSTVPGFPGLYNIQLQCIGYDAYQKDTEAINGHTPFDSTNRETVKGKPDEGKGTKSDAISQSISGLENKISQDVTIEDKMRKYCQLYPDLKLPTYEEVNEVITKICEFRKKNTTEEWPLSEYPLEKYPNNIQRMAHGILNGTVREDGYFVTNVPELVNTAEQYDLYVDPDFYVFYPMTYKDMLNDNAEVIEEEGLGYTNPEPQAREDYYKSTYTVYPDTTDSNVPLAAGANSEDVEGMLELAVKQLGKDYVWGAAGPNAWDCSGFVWWITKECGIQNVARFTTQGMMNYTTINWNGVDDDGKPFFLRFSGAPGEIKAHANPGDILLCSDHTGFAYDSEQYIHASGGRHTNHHIKLTRYSYYCKFTKVLGIKKFYKNATEQKDNDSKAASNNEPKGQKHEGTSKKKKKIVLSGTFHDGDDSQEVKKLQKALNRLVGTKLELDGKYGTETKKAVKKFQKEWNKSHEDNILEIDGIAGPKTVEALNKKLKKDYSKNSHKIEVKTSTTEKKVINAIDIANIAKAMCAKYYGRADAKYMAIAQCIYDRVTDPNGKYGTLQNILGSQLFGKMTEKDINKTPAYRCAKAVFNEGKRAFEQRCIYFTKDENDDKVKDNYKELATLGKFTFYTDGKTTSSKKFKFKENEEPEKTTTEKEDGTNQVSYDSTVYHGVTQADLSWIERFGKPCILNAKASFRGDNSLLGGIFKSVLNVIGSKKGIPIDSEYLTEENQETLDELGVTEDIEDVFTCQEKIYREKFNTDDNILLTAFCDQAEYSGKGKLIRAFPTYFFTIIDEDGAWLDGRKLWGNYYFLRSLVEIQAVSYDDNPAQHAVITVSNAYGNLSHRAPNSYTYKIKNDDEYNGFQKFMYETFAVLPSFKGKKLTSDLVERKNIIYDSMLIRAGCRCQLRMGYGSDPLGLPIILNGFLTDVTVGDIMSFACVSDGQELMNDIISDNPKDTNGIFKSQESSNMCMDVLTKRASFLNALMPNYFENSKYGIEHFGIYFSEHADAWDYVVKNSHGKVTEEKENARKIKNKLDSKMPGGFNYNDEDEEYQGDNIVTGALAVGANSVKNIADGIATIGKKFVGKMFWGELKDIQYDICKNIYRGTYEGASHAMYSPFTGFADGEKNIVFSQYNKTPWDVIQISAQNVSEFMGYPLYYQFESRLFLGLPWFMNKYRYDIINGEIYEEAKTAAQVHFIDSLTDIIDNQMKCTRKGVDTNAIVMYTEGKSPRATPTLYTDRTMEPSYQSTKIYDSSVSQNIIGPDALWHAMGFHMGEDGAVRLGISQLLINWSKAYKGDIILIGDGGIKPYDYIYLNDRFNNIMGLCTARCVTHTFTAATGFTTTFTPGMIGFSTKCNSSGDVVMSNYASLCGAFSYFTSIKKSTIEMSELNHRNYSFARDSLIWHIGYEIGRLGVHAGTALGAFTGKHGIIRAVKSIGKAGYEAYKSGDYIKNLKNIGSALSAMKTNLSKLSSLGKMGKEVVSTAKTLKGAEYLGGAITAVTSLNPYAVIAKVAIMMFVNTVLNAVINYFEYRHCVSVLPLRRNNMAYIPTTYGSKFILPSEGEDNPSTKSANEVAGDERSNKSIQSDNDEDYEIKTTEDEE